MEDKQGSKLMTTEAEELLYYTTHIWPLHK